MNPKNLNGLAVLTCQQTMNVFVKSPVSDLQIELHSPVHGKSKSVKFQNDIYLLFNQQRLDRMSLERFSVYLNDIQTSVPALSSLRSKVSDSDLHKFVKSRYIQSKSELLAWSIYLTSQADIVKQEVSELIQQMSAEKDDSVETPVE